MAGRRDVGDADGHAVVEHVQHLADQDAGVQRHGLARLQIDPNPVPGLQIAHEGDQIVGLIVGAGDVVPPAQVQPFDPAQQRRQLRLHRRPDARQRLEILLAQRMDMQTIDADQMVGRQLRHRKAQARTGLGRVVFGDLAFGMFGVQPQADLERLPFSPGLGDQIGEAGDLGRVVEDDVVRQTQDLGQVLRRIGRRIGGQLALVELARQPRLPQARGADPVEVFADHIGQRPHRKRLQRQKHARLRSVAHALQHGQIATDGRLVHHEGGRGDAVQVEMRKGARIAGLGLHSVGPIRSPEGRPGPEPSTAGRACSACP